MTSKKNLRKKIKSCILSVSDKLCLTKIYLLKKYLILIQRYQSMEEIITKFGNFFQPLLITLKKKKSGFLEHSDFSFQILF